MLIRIGAAIAATLALLTLVLLIARRAPSVVHQKRTYRAPVERVWSALTDPAKVGAWWAPKGFEATLIKNDVRVGGRYQFCVKAKDEGETVCTTGVYDDVNPGHALSATASFCDENGTLIPGRLAPLSGHWPDQWRLEYLLTEGPAGVRVDVWQRGVPMIMKVSMKWGWRQRLVRLNDLL